MRIKSNSMCACFRLLAGCSAILLALFAQAAAPATVTFSLDFPGSDPEHYSIAIQSDGHAKYESRSKAASAGDPEAYQMEFSITDAIRARIFDLAARAHYFSGKIDSGNKKLAFSGAKKLSYSDGQRSSSADYNYSPQPPVQQLTTVFQSISATLEFGRRLAYDHRYQKLALDEESKHMEDQAKSGELAELQTIKPILQAIYDDPSVINVVRARVQRIMEVAPSTAPAR